MESFFENVSMFFTAARANIVAGVAHIKDDTGLEQMTISNEFETLNSNFILVMRRSAQISDSFRSLCKNLINLSNSLCEVAINFEKCFAFVCCFSYHQKSL